MLSAALGTAIGLIFIFFLFSLFLSAVLEVMASALKLRGRALEVAVKKMLDDPSARAHFGGFGFLNQLGAAFSRGSGVGGAAGGASGAATADAPEPVEELASVDPGVTADEPERFEAPTETRAGDFVETLPLRFNEIFCHPLVGGTPSGKRPSYIPAENFSSAVLALLRRNGEGSLSSDVERGIASLPPGRLRTALTTIAEEAQGDIDKLRLGVERWYDHAMDRLSGEYKRFSQAITFGIALLLAILFNIDTVALTQRLSVDPVLRQALESQATQYVQQAGAAGETAAPASAEQAFEEKMAAARTAREELLRTMPLPGWEDEENVAGESEGLGVGDRLGMALNAVSERPLVLLGWLATALAAMLGAPFWFDLLQKLVNLRGTGPKPSADRLRQGERA